jgi:hypothetical protein
MERIYITLNRETRRKSFLSATTITLCCITIVFMFLFVRNIYSQSREELIEKLGIERKTSEINDALKVELAGTTRARYLELEAKERLGLKRARTEEVFVLR